jgi:hypothetical protein
MRSNIIQELNELIEAGSSYNDAESIRLRKLFKQIHMQLYRDTFLRQDYEALTEQHHKVAVEYNKLTEQLKIHADGAGMNYLAERCQKLEQEVSYKDSLLESSRNVNKTLKRMIDVHTNPAFRAYMSHGEPLRPTTPASRIFRN